MLDSLQRITSSLECYIKIATSWYFNFLFTHGIQNCVYVGITLLSLDSILLFIIYHDV